MFILGARFLLIGLIVAIALWQLIKYYKKLVLVDNRREKLNEAVTTINETLDEAAIIPDALKDKDINNAKTKINKILKHGETE